MNFLSLTAGQAAYIALLFNKYKLSKNVHKNHEECFYVEASELQTVFGSDYRKTIEPFMTCKDESYEISNGCTKAYTFTDETIAALYALKPHQIKLPTRSTMDKTYEEKLSVSALTEVINTWDLKEETKLQLIILRAQIDEHGRNIVWYRRTSGSKGRRFAACVSLQGIPDAVRQAIIDVSYTDVDMVNAHPTLFLGFAKKLGLECASISRYVSQREMVLSKVMGFFDVSRDAAKELMLQLSYGAGLTHTMKLKKGKLNAFTQWCVDYNVDLDFHGATPVLPSFLSNFKKEMQTIGAALMKDDVSAWLPQTKRDYVAKGTALFLQSIEDEALDVIEKWCAYKGIVVMSLAFDGLIVEGNGHDFSECEIIVNHMLKDIYGIDAGLKLKIKTEVKRD